MRKLISLFVAVLICAMWQPPAGAEPAVPVERHGLRGDYHLSTGPGRFDFGELKASVVDPNLELADLNPVLKELTGREDDVTVRWTGRIRPAHSETYTFSMIGDNGFRLWVDGRLLIDNWQDVWDVEKVGAPIALEGGRAYDIKVEYFEHFGGAHLRLRWQSPSLAKEIVPADVLFLPEGFDPPGPVEAQVSEAGDRVTLTFDEPLGALPAGVHEHLAVTVSGTRWPVESATAQGQSLVLALGAKIPKAAGQGVRASYDGHGGVTEPFTRAVVLNRSAYVLQTRWSKDVDAAGPLPEYPRPQLVRNRWRSLNGTWQFAPAEAGEAPPTGRDLAERIVVPYPVESTLSGIGRHEERMWYRRTFTVPRSWQKERVLLHLDAVDYESVVYVNGQRVGAHKGGYDRFTVDVTDALSDKGGQELVVGVHDPTDPARQALGKQRLSPGGIMYTSASGIWQSVWLEPVAAQHITSVDTTPDVAGQALRVKVNGTGGQAEITARAGDRVVGRVSGAVGAELTLPVPNPRLWSPDDPFLYDLTVEVGKDRVRSYFGMRSIAVEQGRILLNGSPVFQLGPLDQGFWPDGIYTAPTDEALRFDLEETKRLGFNAVRKHVKVESDRWYHHADRLGLLVWQDMPAMFGTGARQQYETELRRMVDQHRSSPSIVMWVPFNEGWGQYDQARIADLVKSWDPSRLVDNMSGINCCGAVDGGNGDIIDFHIYPGPGNPGRPTAARALVLGEYGGLGLPLIGHTWSGGGWGYAVEPDRKALTDRYVGMNAELRRLHACNGLSAAIYTQTTDVETELNGLITYDREITKPDVQRIHDANKALTGELSPSCAS
ncbi:PA14 domain-containing protein [Nonomuraea africana]|uniref:PA14 domain-containing protein n=1 Tax=Nonomuraea africana TaxID=46171 RepID=A0ABR9KC22_9ACTN|nr:PA14 domain-containing protein [Nonomuraea africana]MBE1559564.1 hypothetical protein [Nonomuraea africana]